MRRVTGDPAYRVFFFGSWVSGQARKRSDIDIGIEGPAPVEAGQMLQILEACEMLPTLYTVDLVDFALLAPNLRDRMKSHALELEAF